MITTEAVTAILIAVISLGLEIIPGLSELWDKVPTKSKPLAFMALCFVVAFGMPMLACLNITLGSQATCPVGDVTVFIDRSILVALASWMTVSAAFGFIQDPMGKRIKSKVAVSNYIEGAKKSVKG